MWDGFGFTVNARLRNGLTTQIGAGTGRGAGRHLRDGDEVQQRPHAASVKSTNGPDPRGCHNVEPWQTTLARPGELYDPEDRRPRQRHRAIAAGSPAEHRQPCFTGANSAQWQVPNSVIAAALGHLPPGATPTGNTTIQLADNEHRVYSDERRTQIDVRFAKILRFGRTRSDVGVDVNNLLNTNYATGFNTTYIYNTDNAPRPAGWGTPTSIYNPRFVRLNFTVNF